MRKIVQHAVQVSLLVFGPGALVSTQAAVPVESVQPSGYGYSSLDQGYQSSEGQRPTTENQEQTTAPAQQTIASAQQGGSATNEGNGSASWIGALLNQVNALQQQVQELKGQLEEQNHTIAQMQAQSKKRYLDIDRRLAQLASSGNNLSARSLNANAVSQENAETVTPSAGIKQLTDKDAYQNAFVLIGQQKFDQAIAAFSNFMSDYPDSKYCANAQYWLGEIYNATGKADLALQAFSKVVDDYPKSNKMADAMYKLGQIYAQTGNKVQARKYLQQVITKYPNSSAAQLSETYLKTISQ